MTAAWIASNAFALALITVCWKLPKVGRATIGLGFAAAALFNTITVLGDPQSYVQGFGPEALFPFYQNFIFGPLAANPASFILPIAAGQLLVGGLMFFKGRKARPATSQPPPPTSNNATGKVLRKTLRIRCNSACVWS